MRARPDQVPARLDRVRRALGTGEDDRAIDWAMGAALLIRREAFEAVGGFDPAQWMYAEDLDLAWRLKEAGMGNPVRRRGGGDAPGGASSGQAFSADEGRFIVTRAYYDWLWRRRGRLVFWAILGVNMAGGLLRRGGSWPSPPELGGDRARVPARALGGEDDH